MNEGLNVRARRDRPGSTGTDERHRRSGYVGIGPDVVDGHGPIRLELRGKRVGVLPRARVCVVVDEARGTIRGDEVTNDLRRGPVKIVTPIACDEK